MSLRNLSSRHIRLICSYQTRYMLRSGGGLVFLLIALVFGLTAAHAIISPVEMLIAREAKDGRQANPEKVVAHIVGASRPVVRWVLNAWSHEESDASEAAAESARHGHMSPAAANYASHMFATDPWTTFLLDDRPALLSAVFLILVFGMPLLIGFLAFNQLAGDVQSRGVRYILLRTDRGNVFLGRFLGTAIFSTAVMAFIIATITFYLGVKIRIYSTGMLALWGLHGFIALSILMLPYIALCSWISALVDSPFISLVMAKGIIGGVVMFALLGGMLWKPAKYLRFALPWGVQNYLFHPALALSLGAVGACLGYTLLFLVLGYHRFDTRDL